jgi:hypothetical protein
VTFDARTRTELVREGLARLAARYEGDGERLDVRVGSPAWLRAQGIAAILEMLDLQAAGAEDQILPDRAAGLHLAAHGELAEVPQSGDGVEAWRHLLPQVFLAGSLDGVLEAREELSSLVHRLVVLGRQIVLGDVASEPLAVVRNAPRRGGNRIRGR